jgi:flagellar biogenesis protein FliO
MIGNGAAAGASYGDLLVTSLLVLGAVCIAAFIAVRLFGRWLSTGRARGAHLMDVVARVPLEPRRSLFVVDVAGKSLLVGTSEMGLSVLSELDPAEVRARVQARPSFGELVQAAWKRRRGRHAQSSHVATIATEAAAGITGAPAGAGAGAGAAGAAGTGAGVGTGTAPGNGTEAAPGTAAGAGTATATGAAAETGTRSGAEE